MACVQAWRSTIHRRVHGERKTHVDESAYTGAMRLQLSYGQSPEGARGSAETRETFSRRASYTVHRSFQFRHWSGENVCMYARLLDQADETIAEATECFDLTDLDLPEPPSSDGPDVGPDDEQQGDADRDDAEAMNDDSAPDASSSAGCDTSANSDASFPFLLALVLVMCRNRYEIDSDWVQNFRVAP